jgi:hypothetical protein
MLIQPNKDGERLSHHNRAFETLSKMMPVSHAGNLIALQDRENGRCNFQAVDRKLYFAVSPLRL